MLAKQPPRGYAMVMFDVYASDDDYRLGREFNYTRRVHGSGSQAYAASIGIVVHCTRVV